MQQGEFKILLVDDEPDILEFLSYNLEKEGFQIFTAETGSQAIEKALEHRPDLIVLDVMIPEMDGMEICGHLRSQPEFENVIIVFLTARNEDYSQIAGFDVGADDYITKPVKPKVFVSRIKALLRRKEVFRGVNRQSTGDLIIDAERYLVVRDGEELTLPRKEFELLKLLASKPERVFTRDEILSRIWGKDIIVGDRTIDVHIRKLREKLGEQFIKTVKGVGYKFTP